mmetsp:Transcript_37424/g.117728  ORF Transcript_37424/g.117728 Transcript_37424/m.117728 type:complete len:240 (+) Transcript_37424:503-1222(+)
MPSPRAPAAATGRTRAWPPAAAARSRPRSAQASGAAARLAAGAKARSVSAKTSPEISASRSPQTAKPKPTSATRSSSAPTSAPPSAPPPSTLPLSPPCPSSSLLPPLLRPGGRCPQPLPGRPLVPSRLLCPLTAADRDDPAGPAAVEVGAPQDGLTDGAAGTRRRCWRNRCRTEWTCSSPPRLHHVSGGDWLSGGERRRARVDLRQGGHGHRDRCHRPRQGLRGGQHPDGQQADLRREV